VAGFYYNVCMTVEQYNRAIKVGTLRHKESIKRGCQQAYGAEGHNLQIDILGAAGEYAYCIYTDQEWTESVNTFKAPDVGINIQIRTTTRTNGRLIVRSRDKDNELFVLVIASPNERLFKIVGSILGKDAKQPRFLDAPNNRPTAWFVEQSALTEIENKQKTEKCFTCCGSGKELIEGLDIQIDCSTCNGTGITLLVSSLVGT
jgi:hypothetical protein